MTTFVWVALTAVFLLLLVAQLSDALRDGGARRMWTNRKAGAANLRRWAFTLALFALGVNSAARWANADEPSTAFLPVWLSPLQAAVFFMWGTWRLIHIALEEFDREAAKRLKAGNR